MNSNHALPIFHALAVGVQHIYPKIFIETAKFYNHYVSMSSVTDQILTDRYFHIFLITYSHPRSLNLLNQYQIHFPQMLCLFITENHEQISELLDHSYLFWQIDTHTQKSTEYSLHQMWRWIRYTGYRKIGIDDSTISVAGGTLSLINETFEKNSIKYSLTNKQVAILKILLEYRGEIVSRNVLLDRIWSSEKFVTDRVIDTNIVAIRKMFMDNGRNPRYLQTIFGQGYRLICE